jgi:WD40 repeat protein
MLKRVAAAAVTLLLHSCGGQDAAQSAATAPATASRPSLGEPIVLGARVATRPGGIQALAATADGKLVFTADEIPQPGWPDRGGEPGIFVWQRRGWRLLARLGDRRSRELATTADGSLVVSADEDGQVRTWEVAGRKLRSAVRVDDAGTEIASANRHDVLVTAADLAPDGAHLATADRSGVVLVWPLR